MSGETKERPIVFSGPMVAAILAGRKTRTRRKVRPRVDRQAAVAWQPPSGGTPRVDYVVWTSCRGDDAPMDAAGGVAVEYCPYGEPGDRLWVKEALIERDGGVFYEADGTPVPGERGCVPWPWRSPTLQSRFCPRWASRLALKVESVRVERLRSIDDEGATAEGVPSWLESLDGPRFDDAARVAVAFARSDGGRVKPRLWFAALWESIHGPGSWDADPLVWVVGFRVVKEGRRT